MGPGVKIESQREVMKLDILGVGGGGFQDSDG